jgi:predicted metal-dependent phosphoesterase TrpH
LKLRIDLHVHTDRSVDSRISFDEAIRRCKVVGLNGFAVTNHDTVLGVDGATKKREGLVVIQGIEVSARGGHVLALDVSESISAGLSMAETVDEIHDQGALAVLAHPYSILRTWVNRLEIKEAGFDAIEVANAAQFPYQWMLRRNTSLANSLELPETGGSDAHEPWMVGRAFTVVEAESLAVEDIISSIRMGRTEAHGSGISLFERLKGFTEKRIRR